MSCKSVLSNSIKSNSDAPQWIKSQSSETNVKFAGDEAKDRLYEPKHKKKLVRVLTVIAYMFSVSLAAIMLSLYYVFIWNPNSKIKITGNTGGSALTSCHGILNEPKLERLIYQDMPFSTLESSSGVILTTEPSQTYDTTLSPKKSIILQKLLSNSIENFTLNETMYE